MPYVDLTAEQWRVISNPGPINVADASDQLGIAALFTTFLAQHVFDAFGIGDEQVRAVLNSVAVALNSN